MAKDIYEENKELKRTLYIIEKALCDFRLTQLDLPLETINVPSVFTKAEPVIGVTTCTCNETCSCDEEKEVLQAEIDRLKAKLKKYEEPAEVKPVPLDEEDEQVFAELEDIPADDDEDPLPAPVPTKKERKQRKERGGTVFKDFKTLKLENNNDYEGNSIIYSKRDN